MLMGCAGIWWLSGVLSFPLGDNPATSASLVCCSLKLDIQSQIRKDINSKKHCEK
jgi:hypothetical protein